MRLLTISELKALALRGETVDTLAHVQVDNVHTKTTKDGKPYHEVHLLDSRDRITLRAWSDTPTFSLCAELKSGHCIEISGEFSHHASFGLEARRWSFRTLSLSEQMALLAGPPELRAKQEADYAFILETLESLRDPRLRYVWELFLADYGERFRRTAAARSFHHARRGGLVEHVAGMMRTANAIAGVYPRLNRDLLLSGVLFHDCGKLWENHVAECGFAIEHCEQGELLGHINMGIEIVNHLWRKMRTAVPYAGWKKLEPACECVRLHLLHLIASHHGEMSFGSPVLPKTPEAHTLHYVDNLDAKLEMVFNGYATASQVAPNIFDRVRPLTQYHVQPLSAFQEPGNDKQAVAFTTTSLNGSATAEPLANPLRAPPTATPFATEEDEAFRAASDA